MVVEDDYFAARDQFVRLAAELGLEQQRRQIAATGRRGESLSIDVARTAMTQAPGESRPLLIVTSGLHGAEGPLGSAVQVSMMRRWIERGLPEAVDVLLVHALNPYGFAWSRRWNEENVDLNRNFLLDGERYDGAPEVYDRLDPFLNPRRPPARFSLFWPRAVWTLLRHGKKALAAAIVSGQYHYPKGLFFGGHKPAESIDWIQSQWPQWCRDADPVLHLDFHSGLGRWGQIELLLDRRPTEELHAWLVRHFGRDRIASYEQGEMLYRARGGFATWCTKTFSDRRYAFLCAEAGTYGSLPVIAGLRAENQAHHWSAPDSAARTRQAARVSNLFCPRSATWRRMVLDEGTRLVECGVEALQQGVAGA